MNSTRTILELKSFFIRRQLRILSENLEPHENWRDYAGSEEEDLSEKAVEDALQKLNTALRQHNRVVYSAQAVHHVAQQIASLYWSLVTRDNSDLGGRVNGVEKTADLSKHATIAKLPVVLEDANAEEKDRIRYQQLRERLIHLDTRRQQKQRRLSQLQELQRLLIPFQNPRENIQPNLVTRDGDLFKELEKMRMLTARVGGRISQRKTDKTNDREVEALPGFDQKLETVLNSMAS